jgi:hypothetical protein
VLHAPVDLLIDAELELPHPNRTLEFEGPFQDRTICGRIYWMAHSLHYGLLRAVGGPSANRDHRFAQGGDPRTLSIGRQPAEFFVEWPRREDVPFKIPSSLTVISHTRYNVCRKQRLALLAEKSHEVTLQDVVVYAPIFPWEESRSALRLLE